MGAIFVHSKYNYGDFLFTVSFDNHLRFIFFVHLSGKIPQKNQSYL